MKNKAKKLKSFYIFIVFFDKNGKCRTYEKITHLTLIIFEYIINLECDFMDKYNIEEIKEKLEYAEIYP